MVDDNPISFCRGMNPVGLVQFGIGGNTGQKKRNQTDVFLPRHQRINFFKSGDVFFPMIQKISLYDTIPKLDTNAVEILTMQCTYFRIYPTGRLWTNGLPWGDWIEVTVLEYDEEYCVGWSDPINQYTGWMPALDSRKRPTIWMFAKGC